MNFSFDDDEGELGGGSKLSSLFGIDKASNQGGNESLTFTAPKQPKKSGKDTASGVNKSSLLLAVAVHAYRFSNGTYIKHGKLGAAILGNHNASDYKILLYISKMQQVTHVRITPQFLFTIQANNYATFYDEQRQNWSIMFESEQNAIDFAKQVALAKLNSASGVTTSVIPQDLMVGKGDAVITGDSVEVKYTGWLYQSKMFGDIFDSNANVDKPFRFKIGKGKVIKGWEEGVTGMKKGGRRLLVIPPAFAYGKKGLSSRIPPNSTLIFDIEIKKVKIGRDKEDDSMSSDAAEMTKSSDERIASPNINRMKNGPESSRNDDSSPKPEQEPMSPTTSSKAKLISRMAKMGQPMLPLSGATIATDNSTDSEADEASASSDTGAPPIPSSYPPPRKPMKAPRKHIPNPPPTAQHIPSQPPPQMSSSQHHQLAIYQSQPQQPQYPEQMQQQPTMGVNANQQPMQFQQQQQQPMQGNIIFGSTNHQVPMTQHPPMGQQMNNPVAFHQTQMAPTSVYSGSLVSSSEVQTTLVLSEARQHHSDLRQAVIQVTDKINNISQKIDQLHASRMQDSMASSNIPNMEANILMQNIQRIMQDNERLKKDVYEKSSKIQTQNDKISELLQRNQMYVEESNTLLEKRNDTFKQTANQSQLRVLELEQEKVKLTTDLSNATANISTLQLELGQVQQREADIRSKFSSTVASTEDQQGELDLTKVQCREAEKKVETLSRTLKEEKQVKKQLESRINNLEEELADIKAEKEAVEKNLLERRKKAAAEKQRTQEEMEEMKRSYEEELGMLKSRLRQQKSSTDAATAEQVSQIEKELEVQFRERSERIIGQTKETYQREINEVKEEKEQFARKLAAIEQKMLTLRSSQGTSTQQIDELQDKLEESQAWKDKYESLHANAFTMKEKYEKRIKELMKESPRPGSPSGNVVDEVKKVMNNVYHSLKSEFDISQSYKGTEILGTIMNTIKKTTIRLVQQQTSQEDEESDESEEEEEEEEESEDEETDEEQVTVEREAPLQASAQPNLASAPPLPALNLNPEEHKDSIPDLPEVDQSSQEGESLKGEVAEDDQEEEEKAEGDGDWEESHQDEGAEMHDENPESDAIADDGGQRLDEASGPLADSIVNVPNLPDIEPSSETVEADSQQFGEDSEPIDKSAEADSQPVTEDSKTEDSQSDEKTEDSQPVLNGAEAEGSEPSGKDAEADSQRVTEDSKTEDSQSESKTEDSGSVSNKAELNSQLFSKDSKAEDSQPIEVAEVEDNVDKKDSEDKEDDKVEVEQAEAPSSKASDPLSVPIMTRDPPDMPPELPPDLPPNDEDEEPEEDRKVKSRGLFSDDSDDDFFDAVPPARKNSSEKKKETAAAEEEDEESLKPKPPPPLFGDSDDDDDLDWIN